MDSLCDISISEPFPLLSGVVSGALPSQVGVVEELRASRVGVVFAAKLVFHSQGLTLSAGSP